MHARSMSADARSMSADATMRDDVPLTREHVQPLSSADQLADFFAHLRYPSGARVPMTPQSSVSSTT
jgi:hypothetical protein